jgi:hypothetical protein
MGNVSAYKEQGIREAIEAAGASQPASFTTACGRFCCKSRLATAAES